MSLHLQREVINRQAVCCWCRRAPATVAVAAKSGNGSKDLVCSVCATADLFAPAEGDLEHSRRLGGVDPEYSTRLQADRVTAEFASAIQPRKAQEHPGNLPLLGENVKGSCFELDFGSRLDLDAGRVSGSTLERNTYMEPQCIITYRPRGGARLVTTNPMTELQASRLVLSLNLQGYPAQAWRAADFDTPPLSMSAKAGA